MTVLIRHTRTLAVAIFALMLSGTVLAPARVDSQPASLPSASRSGVWFPYRQGWLGADGAYSVPLGGGRILWVFGDTFTGPVGAKSRKQATGFIHNSIAISTCSGLRNCSFQYYWRGKGTSSPKPMFSEGTKDWFWPMDGFVYKGGLYLALMQMHATGQKGAFGFAYSGVQLACIRNYTAPPRQWTVRYQHLNTGGAAIPGVSIVVGEGPNGNPDPSNPKGADYAYFFTLVRRKKSGQYMGLLRLPLSQLSRAGRPGNARWEYLRANSTWGAWPDTDTALPHDNAVVLSPGATEMTVRYHKSTKQWIAVYPVGLAKSAHYSLSSSMTGPWGKSEKLYTYPEMQPSNPNYTPNVFCYAAKEHIELERPGQIFITYACNSTRESEVIDNMGLYHPIVVTEALPSH